MTARRSHQLPATGSAGEPQFGEHNYTPDPATFEAKHPSDNALYKEIDKKKLGPVPATKGDGILKLETVYGTAGKTKVESISKAGQIVFHSGGDTGPIKGPASIESVVDKMENDFIHEEEKDVPSFFFHLGDVVYSFGEAQYYYDQFYEPFRNYPAPILAIAGNHDGLVYQSDKYKPLEAFLANFVTDVPTHTPEAGGLGRTSMVQPGVYFVLDAPFVVIIGLYSNVLEDPGVISEEQIAFLTKQLKNYKSSGKVIIVAMHHPPYTSGQLHGGSPKMLADLDKASEDAGFWPHAYLSGHAHNYQRYTRTIHGKDIPYIVCGNSGHGLGKIAGKGRTVRTPYTMKSDNDETLIFENYDDANYGYLRIVCDASTLRIEYHDAQPGQKTGSDAVTVDLKSHTMISN